MNRVRIKNFGPIKEGFQENDGWMDINKVTVFIGNQGSGKSTVAKVISTLTWLEKAINRGDEASDAISSHDFLHFFEFQRIESYFREETEIDYIGERMTLSFRKKEALAPKININVDSSYIVPKVMYVPAERNFLSVIKNAYGITNLPETLATFGEELKRGQLKLNDKPLDLPINQLKYSYSKELDKSTLTGLDHTIDLLAASSGLQSLVPLYLVTYSLSNDIKNSVENLTIEQRLRKEQEISEMSQNFKGVFLSDLLNEISRINAKFRNKCLVNVVEEPEQNLFPTSQWEILKSLLKFNNIYEGNKLIITTHSPYIINYLSLSVQAADLESKLTDNRLIARLNKIVPIESVVNANNLIIYEVTESGTIRPLRTYDGIPSDQNYLNNSLAEGNNLFDALLELEQEL